MRSFLHHANQGGGSGVGGVGDWGRKRVGGRDGVRGLGGGGSGLKGRLGQ